VYLQPDVRVRSTIALALVIGAFAAQAAAQGSPEPRPLDLPAFIEELDRHADAIERTERPRIARVLVDMPHAYRVRHGDRTFDVPFERIAQRVFAASRTDADWPSARQAAIDDLRRIRDDAAALRDAGTVLTSSGRSALNEILSRREFQRLRSPDWQSGLRRRVTEWLQALWQRLGGDRMNRRSVATLVAWTAALAAIIALAVWFSRRARWSSQASALRIGNVPRVSSQEWASRAVEALRRGHGREAVRCSYRAALSRLEEQGRWRIDESRTAREYLMLLEASDPFRDVFMGLARQFERAWYASLQVTPHDERLLIEALERLGCLRQHEPAI
jgi:uncharacterized protein DUF4129